LLVVDIADFISPTNPLVQTLLMIDSSSKYQISLDYLTPRSKRILQEEPDHFCFGKNVKDKIIMFSLIEYYFYCFSNIPNQKQQKDLTEKPYLIILQQYFDYFFPKKNSVPQGTPVKDINFLPKEGRSSVSNYQSIKKLPTMDNSNVFKCHAIDDLSLALNISSFFGASFIELLLCQNDYEVLETPGMKIPVYIKPNQFLLNCVSKLIGHLLSLDIRVISSESMSRMYCDRNGGHSGVVYDIAKANLYRSFGANFYRFISAAMQHWPMDDSVYEIVKLWLLFAFPWRAPSPGYFITNLELL
jgi:hypothetical protein